MDFYEVLNFFRYTLVSTYSLELKRTDNIQDHRSVHRLATGICS